MTFANRKKNVISGYALAIFFFLMLAAFATTQAKWTLSRDYSLEEPQGPPQDVRPTPAIASDSGTNAVVEELLIEESPERSGKATLVAGNTSVRVFPDNPAATSLQSARVFRYPEPIVFVKDKEKPLYNPQERTLRLTFVIPDPTAFQIKDAMNDVRRQLWTSYNPGLTTPSELPGMTLLPIEVEGYTISLLDDEGLALKTDTGTGRFQTKQFRYKVKEENETLHKLLSTSPGDLEIKIEARYRMRTIKTRTLTETVVKDAWRKVFEKLGRPGQFDGDFVADRDVVQKVLSGLKTQIDTTIELPAGESPQTLAQLKELAKQATDTYNAKLIDISSPESLTESGLIWTSNFGAQELRPTTMKSLTTATSSWDKYTEAWDKGFETLKQLANTSDSLREFSEKVDTSIATNGNVGVSVIGIVDLSAGGGLSGSRGTAVATKEKRYENLYRFLKDAGTDKGNVMKEAYKSWAGKAWKDETRPKELRLVRVATGEIIGLVRSGASIVTETGSRTKSTTQTFPLSKAISDWDDPFRVPEKAHGFAATKDVGSSRQTDTVTIRVLDNDKGDDLLVQNVTAPSSGVAAVSPDGKSVTYKSNQLFLGEDRFRYRVRDQYGQTAEAEVTVNVVQVAVANADNARVKEGTPIEIDVLSNDRGDDIKLVSLEAPTKGVATIRNSKIYYIPTPGQLGIDSIRYRISDKFGATVEGQANIEVFPQNLSTITLTVHTDGDDKDRDEPVTFQWSLDNRIVAEATHDGEWGDQSDRTFDFSTPTVDRTQISRLILRVYKKPRGSEQGHGWRAHFDASGKLEDATGVTVMKASPFNLQIGDGHPFDWKFNAEGKDIWHN